MTESSSSIRFCISLAFGMILMLSFYLFRDFGWILKSHREIVEQRFNPAKSMQLTLYRTPFGRADKYGSGQSYQFEYVAQKTGGKERLLYRSGSFYAPRFYQWTDNHAFEFTSDDSAVKCAANLEVANSGHCEPHPGIELLDKAMKYYEQKDYQHAVILMEQAASSGYQLAQSKLGSMYDNGEGVKKDEAKAFSWYLKAARQGENQAQNLVGQMYQAGRGVGRDDAQAHHWFLEAAQLKNQAAIYALGELNYQGAGVPKNYATAYKWAYIAHQLGYKETSGGMVPDLLAQSKSHLSDSEIKITEKDARLWMRQHPFSLFYGGTGASPIQSLD